MSPTVRPDLVNASGGIEWRVYQTGLNFCGRFFLCPGVTCVSRMNCIHSTSYAHSPSASYRGLDRDV